MTSPAQAPPKVDKSTPKPPASVRHALSWVTVALVLVGATLAVAMLIADLDRLTIGILTIVLLLVLMLLGIPVGIAMIVSSALGLYGLGGTRVVISSLQELFFDGVANWSLSVIPMFTLMGFALLRGGITTKAFNGMYMWLGGVPGGPAIATTGAGAGLAASSGSTMGVSLALGRMAIPEMLKIGYSPKLATATVAMAGTLGQVIPPSILLVVYAGVAAEPVGPQLIAGIVPGVMLAVAFALTALLWALLRPSMAPRAAMDGVALRDRIRALAGLAPLVVIATVVIGGMISGTMTATESASVGALVAIVLGWWGLGKGKRGARSLATFVKDTSVDASSTIASLFLVLIGALMISRTITVSGVARHLTEYLASLELSRVEFLLILVVFYIVLGMFLESIPMILLTIPLLQAPLEALDVDMIWFGVFVIIMCEIGMVFPPIGMLVFVIHRLAQDPKVNLGQRITVTDIYKGVMPFIAAILAIVMLIIVWPDIVLWLPDLQSSP